MATTNQLVSRIKRRLSRQNSTLTDADIIDELGWAQERLEMDAWLPDFLFAEDTIAVTTGDFDLDTVLDRFLRLHDRAGGIRYENPDSNPNEPWLKLTRFDEKEQLLQLYPGELQAGAVPSGYFGVDRLVTLRPRPTVSASVDLQISFYQGEATVPAVGNTNLWTQRAALYLMGEAGMAIAQLLRDQQAFEFFRQMKGEGKVALVRKSFGDEQADQDYQMGDRD